MPRHLDKFVLAGCSRHQAEARKNMTSIDKLPDIDVRTLEYKHPVFILIEDGDEDSIQFYKNAGVPVALIQLPYRRRRTSTPFRRPKHRKKRISRTAA